MTLVHVFNYVETETVTLKHRMPSVIARFACKFANKFMGKTFDYDLSVEG